MVEFPSERELSSDATYYVIYEGSQQRHVTTARLMSSYKLHSIIPGEKVTSSELRHGISNNLTF